MSLGDVNASRSEKLCLVCGGHFVAHNRCPKDGTSLVPINHDAEVGDALGKNYEILGTIGRGGMSIVYKAKHKLMKRVVALKVLTAMDPQSVKRFQLEAQLVSNLQHENIVTVYEFGQADDGRPYISMAYVEGQTLGDIVSSNGPMDYKRALPLFIQACDALAYAHSSGVLHRDLKPSNFIIVPTKKGDEQIKLLDFGIAKQLDAGEDIQQLTASGQVFGSPLYMSPEQCLGHKLDARADIYSFGCVMYELLTGLPPFVGKSPLDTMQMHVQRDAPPLKTVNQNIVVPKEFENIVLRALERDRAQRYKTAESLHTELNYFRIQQKALENSMELVDMNAKFAASENPAVQFDPSQFDASPNAVPGARHPAEPSVPSIPSATAAMREMFGETEPPGKLTALPPLPQTPTPLASPEHLTVVPKIKTPANPERDPGQSQRFVPIKDPVTPEKPRTSSPLGLETTVNGVPLAIMIAVILALVFIGFIVMVLR